MDVERRALAAAVVGSGIAFLDGSIVNVALPAIRADLGADLGGLQWVLNAYLVTLTALLLLGGALGDRYGRRRCFTIGVVGFAAASVACGLAPSTGALIAARAVQGAAAALLIPGSLALLTATVDPDDRARWIGRWSGLTGAASAVGPFVGGWLIDAASWRWAFLINVPFAVAAVVLAGGVPESLDDDAPRHLDRWGAAIAAGGLAALTAGLIGSGEGWSLASAGLTVGGLAALGGFWAHEHRTPVPMLPPSLFRSQQFTGANLVTLAVYAALGVTFFLVAVNLQLALGYSALEAGVALLPVTLLMLVLSPRAGALAQRIGARVPMTVGPLVIAVGVAWLGRVEPGDAYATGVLPPTITFGLGLSLTVAPLTAAVLAAVDDRALGIGSATNNAVARLGGLLAVAVLPAAAGVDLDGATATGLPGYRTAMTAAAVLCLVGAAVAAATIRRTSEVEPSVQPSVLQSCLDPCTDPT
ncbi:MAG: MFS transporter [Acidimicrobiales bacterium]|nr:MFS transporter [Acidimicrobiales bacterium]HRW39235.1 MFS transporter [Aquihabitans sp.]